MQMQADVSEVGAVRRGVKAESWSRAWKMDGVRPMESGEQGCGHPGLGGRNRNRESVFEADESCCRVDDLERSQAGQLPPCLAVGMGI